MGCLRRCLVVSVSGGGHCRDNPRQRCALVIRRSVVIRGAGSRKIFDGVGVDFNYAHWQGKAFLVVVALLVVVPLLLVFLL